MKFLRRNWALLLAAALIPFVILLAYLQQEWIREMGERERARLRQGLFVAGGELASAFQRELLLAPIAIAPPESDTATSSGNGRRPPERFDPYGAALLSGDWSFFAERWRAWRNYALDPDIVTAVHLIQIRRDPKPLVRSWNGSSFSIENDQDLSDRILSTLRSEADTAVRDRGLIRSGDEEWDVVPLPDSHGLVLLVRYNLNALIHAVLPRLADLHLGAMSDYRFRIVDRESGAVIYRTDPKSGDAGFAQPDIRMGLFRRNFGATDNLLARQPGDGQPGRDAFLLVSGGSGKSRDVQIANLFDRVLGESIWTIEAVHRNGSLASVVRGSIIRNLLASTGILLLLVATIIVLALSNRRALALAARQEEFVASVTHELKTPLAVIGSAAANMADGIVKERESTVRYGTTIAAESRRLGAMIDKLLLYTRLGATQDAGNEEVDVGALAAAAITERASELESLGFRVEKSLPATPLIVRGDGNALRLAIANLIANVIIHAAEGAYLGIFVTREEGTKRHRGEAFAVIRIDDRGPGIPRRERKAIFEAFYRGRLARDKQEPGSGIGLNLVRRVAVAHGGDVTLESAEGFGTSVSVNIPLTRRGAGNGKA
ncbi:MAG TPA: HAMP domain-containing sensor histidine kinase [Rectinemataceae bacterium]|nr:HAMP domain-containing sensor histidine kinase [Rectinemataceae bacterium]